MSKFVKSVGKESLIAVPNLDEAERCQPFQVVIKKNRKWFWQSARYEPTPFKLHQLLTTPDVFDSEVETTTRKLTTYNKTYTFDVSGKIGSKLARLLDVELSASDNVNVAAQFGDITKQEVDQPALLAAVEKRSVQRASGCSLGKLDNDDDDDMLLLLSHITRFLDNDDDDDMLLLFSHITRFYNKHKRNIFHIVILVIC